MSLPDTPKTARVQPPKLFYLAGAIWLMFLPTLVEAASPALAAKINDIIGAPEYRQAHWGLLAIDLESGTVIFEHNPEKLFAPASVTKLYSVATALDAFGPNYRFETPIYRRGKLTNGILEGDLILVASGDLTLGGRTDSEGHIAFKSTDHIYANGGTAGELTEPNPLAGLNELAKQVATSGIKRVRGEILVDDRLFEKAEGTGSGPSRLTPMIVNDNLIDFVITPATPGEPAKIDWRPKSEALQVDARVETIKSNLTVRITMTAATPDRVIVRGEIPEGHKPLVRVHEVGDASSFVRALLIEALRRAGVGVMASTLDLNRTGQLPAKESYKAEDRVALLSSPPFKDEAKLILKVSHNLHASTLPLLLAVKSGKRTLADGLHLQHDFLARAGVDVETISFGGGAGGSRADYTTPRATVQLLRYMAQHSYFSVYEDALPVLGVDGTLATVRPKESSVRGKVHAKTGSLFWENTMNGKILLTSRALAGYMQTAKDRKLAFAFFVNNVNVKTSADVPPVMRTLARLCEVVYETE